MQGSIPPKSDNRAIGGELSFANAADKAIFGLLLLPSTVREERIFRFPFTFASRSILTWEGAADKFSNAELDLDTSRSSVTVVVAVGDLPEDVDEFKFNLFRR